VFIAPSFKAAPSLGFLNQTLSVLWSVVSCGLGVGFCGVCEGVVVGDVVASGVAEGSEVELGFGLDEGCEVEVGVVVEVDVGEGVGVAVDVEVGGGVGLVVEVGGVGVGIGVEVGALLTIVM
jgi:hypothetical protein